MEESKSSDIDRGWAYFVAVACFFVYLLAFGLSLCNSVFYIVFLDEFEGDPSTTAWIVTLNTCSTMIFSPLASCVSNWIPPRHLITFGAVLSTAALILTTFATSLKLLFLFYSIGAGLGWCFCLTLLADRMSTYFRRLRGIVVTVATSGIGVGQFIFPPLFLSLEQRYHWRGALLILAGLNLNLLVCAAVMMEPRDVPSDLKPTERTDLRREWLPLKDWRYLLFLLSTILVCIGPSSYQTHIGNYARLFAGCTATQVALLMSCIGLGNLVGRIGLAMITHLARLRYTFVYIVCFVVAGIVSVLSAFVEHFGFLVLLCSLFGFSAGTWGLLVEVVVEIVGITMLTSAVGFVYFCCAIGVLIGGPVAAWLFEIDPSYRTSFIVSGIIVTFGSCLSGPAYLRMRRTRLQSSKEAMNEVELLSPSP